MTTDLKIYTSYIDKENIDRIIELNLLPIFIVRSLGKIDYFRQWAGTAIHFRELSPSQELFWKYRDGTLDYLTYCKSFVIEMASLDFQDVIRRLEGLCKVSNSDGVVLCGIGLNPDNSHRSLVSDVLWRTGYLDSKPYEL